MGIPFGLRDVKMTPITPGTGAFGTPVDLPNSRTFSFEETEDFQDLRGDDKVVATRGQGASVSWELESGGISLEALVVLNGGTVVVSGTGPTQKKTYTKKVTDQRPEFKIEGQALSESGGDFHLVLPRCKTNGSVSGELGDGAFWLTSASGIGMADSSDKLYDFVENSSITPIPVI